MYARVRTRKNVMLTRLYARIDVDLLKRVDKARGEMDRTQFIVEALIEKLERKIKENKDGHATNVFIDEMIALHPKRRMADIKDGTDLIFKEMLKQNEVLKLLLRRTSLSSKFSSTFLKNQNVQQFENDVQIVEDTVKMELQNINLLGDKNE